MMRPPLFAVLSLLAWAAGHARTPPLLPTTGGVDDSTSR
jgi:hypothetical protein